MSALASAGGPGVNLFEDDRFACSSDDRRFLSITVRDCVLSVS